MVEVRKFGSAEIMNGEIGNFSPNFYYEFFRPKKKVMDEIIKEK